MENHAAAVAQAESIARFSLRMNLDPADVAPEVADLTGLDEIEAHEVVMAVMRSQQELDIQAVHDTLTYSAALEAAP
jgi:hypothetical protein